MQKFIIYDANKNNKGAVIFCLVMIAGLGVAVIKIELSFVFKLILLIITGIFGVIGMNYYRKLKDKRPLYIIDHIGIYARRYDGVVPWSDLSYYEFHVKYVRGGAVYKEFRCYNETGSYVLAIDIMDADVTEKSVDRVLQKKIEKKIPERE